MTASGDVQAIQAGSTTTTYGHDFLDRLVSVQPGFGNGYVALSYTYAGDRVKEAWTAVGTPVRRYAYGYDDRTNLSAVSTYDAAGTTVTTTTCLVHDGASRLVAVGPAKVLSGPDATACRSEGDIATVQVRFRYDARNRRVGRWDASTGAWKVHAFQGDGSPLAELGWSGSAWAAQREYVWLDGRPLAQLDAGTASYLHLDQIGLPRAMTGPAGQLVWAAEARPYGDVAETLTTVVTNLRLPGQYDERLLASVGLQGPFYNWNRWYLPSAGRYLELDPIAASGGFNERYGLAWYGYAEQTPLTSADPTGEDRYTWCKMFGALYGSCIELTRQACGATFGRTQCCMWDYNDCMDKALQNPDKCPGGPVLASDLCIAKRSACMAGIPNSIPTLP